MEELYLPLSPLWSWSSYHLCFYVTLIIHAFFFFFFLGHVPTMNVGPGYYTSLCVPSLSTEL